MTAYVAILSFPTMVAACAWHSSPEYQAALPHLHPPCRTAAGAPCAAATRSGILTRAEGQEAERAALECGRRMKAAGPRHSA